MDTTLKKGKKEKKKRKATITMPCHLGLHGRTAALFIFFVRQFDSDIRIIKGNQEVDGRSILGLLTLGASMNSELQIETHGDDADLAIQKIEYYFQDPNNCVDGTL